jgi:hypothetical protein
MEREKKTKEEEKSRKNVQQGIQQRTKIRIEKEELEKREIEERIRKEKDKEKKNKD